MVKSYFKEVLIWSIPILIWLFYIFKFLLITHVPKTQHCASRQDFYICRYTSPYWKFLIHLQFEKKSDITHIFYIRFYIRFLNLRTLTHLQFLKKQSSKSLLLKLCIGYFDLWRATRIFISAYRCSYLYRVVHVNTSME